MALLRRQGGVLPRRYFWAVHETSTFQGPLLVAPGGMLGIGHTFVATWSSGYGHDTRVTAGRAGVMSPVCSPNPLVGDGPDCLQRSNAGIVPYLAAVCSMSLRGHSIR